MVSALAGRQPVLDRLLAEDLDVALLLDVRGSIAFIAPALNILALLSPGSPLSIDAALGQRLHQRLALHLADPLVVESHPQVDRTAHHHAVVRNHLDAGLLGVLEHVEEGRTVLGNDDDGVDLLGDQASICATCLAASPSADSTLTSAPSSLAAAMK